MKEVTDLNSGKRLAVVSSGRHYQKIELALSAGDGILLEARFKNQSGMRFCFESFDQQKSHRVTVNANAEIFNHGNFCADENRSLRLKKDGNSGLPVCILRGLSNRKKPVLTFSKNLSLGKKGITYCLVRGKLKGAVVRSNVKETSASGENLMHLKNIQETAVEKGDGRIICNQDFFRPFVVPPETSVLEFYLAKGDYIEDITIWFVPLGL